MSVRPPSHSSLPPALFLALLASCAPAEDRTARFDVVEATIPEMQQAMTAGTVTARELVEAYLVRIALYEELVRAFLLTELWSFSDSNAWICLSIVLAGVLFGLVHWSQGPYGITTIAIKSIVIGSFYFRIRRLLPLVLAHVLYDGLQVGAFLLTYPSS